MILKPLEQIKLPSLVSNDGTDLEAEVIERIQMNPDWDSVWDGELFQNSYQMILKTFSYLFSRNARSANNRLKEKILNRAYSEQGVYDCLADMRIQLVQSTCAYARLQATIVDNILLEPVIIPKFQKVYGVNPNGESIPFEIIKKDNDGKFNYFDNIIITPTVEFTSYFEVEAYAGETFSYEYEITPQMLENFIIEVKELDIIEDSIRVFYRTMADAPLEIPFTDSFAIPADPVTPYFPDGIPHWTLSYNADGSARILFSSKNFGGAFDSTHVGNTIQVFGRRGGGVRTNVLAGQINYPITLTLSQGQTLNVVFTNKFDALGGGDKEDIFKAQQFAPYRYGRGKPIIDETDAKNKLLNYVVKHEIDTPQYSEIVNTVPLLHAFHKIVPIRDFENFVLPTLESTDTLDTYNAKLLQAINDFCNVEGSHDAIVIGEKMSDFNYPDTSGYASYSAFLSYRAPLSGSLKAIAYDYADRIVDTITFNSNYIVDQKEQGYSINTAPTEHATVTSSAFSSFNMLETGIGKNTRLVFSFDYDRFQYIFDITLTTGVKTYRSFAEELQAAIIDAIDNEASSTFGEYRNWQFVTYEIDSENSALGRVIFKSPLTGIESKIQFYDNGTPDTMTDPQYNIYLFLGVEKRIYRPENETGLVFETGNTYKYDDNVLTTVYKNRYSRSIDKLYDDLGIQINHSALAGPLITILLTGENEDQVEQLFADDDLIVTAYNLASEVERVEFRGISETEDSQGEVIFSGVESVLFKQSTSDHKYVYADGKITLRLRDNLKVDYYTQTYLSIYRVDIVRVIEDPLNPGIYQEDSTFTPIQFLETEGNFTQDVTVEAGKTVELSLTPAQDSTILLGDDLMIKFFHRDDQGNLILIETEKILGILDGLNPFTNYPSVEAVVDQAYGNNQYNKTNRTIKWKFVDGTYDDTVEYYVADFADFDKLTITYKRKTYNYVKLNYRPNPYFPEGEAKAIIDVLASKSNRLVGLEQIIKTLNFTPKPIKLQIVVKRNYPVNEAIDATITQLYSYFGYSNENHEHTVGSLLTHQSIKNAISRIATRYGIVDVKITNDEDSDNILEATTLMKYKFIMDSKLYERIKKFENDNKTVLEGLSSKYKIDITGIVEDLKV